MRRAKVIVSMTLLVGCGPTDEQVAQQCRISVAELKQTKSAVSAMAPYAGVELGKCSVMKDDSGVVVIPPGPKHDADLMVSREKALNAIAKRCGTPSDVWRVVSSDEVQLAPQGASLAKVDCLLSEFRKAKLPVKIGFVGNEYYPENGQ